MKSFAVDFERYVVCVSAALFHEGLDWLGDHIQFINSSSILQDFAFAIIVDFLELSGQLLSGLFNGAQLCGW